MNNENGGGLLTDQERTDYYSKLREAAIEDAQASGDPAGFVIPGDDRYRDDWDFDLSWPEKCPDNMNAQVDSATLVVAKKDKRKGFDGRIRTSTLKRIRVDGSDVQKMREAVEWSKLEEWGGNPDPFAYGSQQAVEGVGGSMSQFLPLWPGPVTRQLYWQDYWQMSAKSFEAYNHDPISWRCVHMKAEFSLGKGLACKVTKTKGTGKGQQHDSAFDIWMEWWNRNKMDQRLDTIARDYCWGGEQFLRYFKSGRKLTIRALDPASIYDLITDPEDIETVFAYHQQFQTPYQLYPPKASVPSTGVAAPEGASIPGQAYRYIIRQILPQEIDHYKANASGYERRGRSDLFPALGWIKRLRDYLTSRVIQADLISRICWDLEVAGNQQAIQSMRNQLFPQGRAPAPGTVFGHNTASKLEAIAPATSSPSTGARGGDPILDALVTMIADSIGLPKDWLGFGVQNTRAGALVATEPAAKSLEELQGTLEGLIHDSFDRVMAAAFITDAELEITFPSIASEDRKQKLDDLGTMEGNGWLSHQTAATMGAKEMGITNYDFDSEQKLIAKEFDDTDATNEDGTPKRGDGKPRRTVMLATKRQAVKLDITKSVANEDEPPGLLVPTDGSAPPTGANGAGQLPAPGSPDGTKRTVKGGGSHDNGVTRGGAPANENPNSAGGAKNIRKENTNTRESEEIVLTRDELDWLLLRERQAATARRRPDDPDFREQADQYQKTAQENLDELVASE